VFYYDQRNCIGPFNLAHPVMTAVLVLRVIVWILVSILMMISVSVLPYTVFVLYLETKTGQVWYSRV